MQTTYDPPLVCEPFSYSCLATPPAVCSHHHHQQPCSVQALAQIKSSKPPNSKTRTLSATTTPSLHNPRRYTIAWETTGAMLDHTIAQLRTVRMLGYSVALPSHHTSTTTTTPTPWALACCILACSGCGADGHGRAPGPVTTILIPSAHMHVSPNIAHTQTVLLYPIASVQTAQRRAVARCCQHNCPLPTSVTIHPPPGTPMPPPSPPQPCCIWGSFWGSFGPLTR